jgi:hypothetical protein
MSDHETSGKLAIRGSAFLRLNCCCGTKNLKALTEPAVIVIVIVMGRRVTDASARRVLNRAYHYGNRRPNIVASRLLLYIMSCGDTSTRTIEMQAQVRIPVPSNAVYCNDIPCTAYGRTNLQAYRVHVDIKHQKNSYKKKQWTLNIDIQ